MVLLKQISRRTHPHELEIATMFSSEPHKSHPKNRCVPIYEVLDVPDDEDASILVMPLLRPLDNPRFITVGEAVECFRQLFEVWTYSLAGGLFLLTAYAGIAIHASLSCCSSVRLLSS